MTKMANFGFTTTDPISTTGPISNVILGSDNNTSSGIQVSGVAMTAVSHEDFNALLSVDQVEAKIPENLSKESFNNNITPTESSQKLIITLADTSTIGEDTSEVDTPVVCSSDTNKVDSIATKIGEFAPSVSNSSVSHNDTNSTISDLACDISKGPLNPAHSLNVNCITPASTLANNIATVTLIKEEPTIHSDVELKSVKSIERTTGNLASIASTVASDIDTKISSDQLRFVSTLYVRTCNAQRSKKPQLQEVYVPTKATVQIDKTNSNINHRSNVVNKRQEVNAIHDKLMERQTKSRIVYTVTKY